MSIAALGSLILLIILVSVLPDIKYALDQHEAVAIEIEGFDPSAPRPSHNVLVHGIALWDRAVLWWRPTSGKTSSRNKLYYVPVVGKSWVEGDPITAVLVTRKDPKHLVGKRGPGLHRGVVRDALWERPPRAARRRLVRDQGLTLDPGLVQIDLAYDRAVALASRGVAFLVIAAVLAFALLRAGRSELG